ncbi:MAG: alpha/beta fold hydrolase [Kofleriaceae bacterium]|nr:alpha/beta fold hydrolase [Kofleriaceae bacterium]MBP9858055.1 alpha/beta fold hydrolase [Kofleriaceae bacterium]
MMRVLGVLLIAGVSMGCGSRDKGEAAPATAAGSAPSAPPGPLSAEDLAAAWAEASALPPRSKVVLRTKLIDRGPAPEAAPVPPPSAPFTLVRYPAAPGPLVAYLTKDPGDGARHPAIVWLTGGDTNTIGDVWTPADPANDQTAAAYREAGLVMMFPSMRGGNDNPGRREGFLGEVDDVIAARAFLASLPYVDPTRIYLGGHSTGGTLALLVAQTTDQFRATISFGPVAFAGDYGGELVYCDPTDPVEMQPRSPAAWLKDLRTPTFVIEGAGGNVDAVRLLRQLSRNPQAQFFEVAGTDHFGVLAPTNALIAEKLIADRGPQVSLTITSRELDGLFRR